MEEQKTIETDAEKIARIEKALEEKDTTIQQKDIEIADLKKKINSIKIDGLVRKVEPKVVEVQEDIEFDFDL